MKNKQKIRRALAVALVLLLVGAMVLSIIVSAVTNAEEVSPPRDQCQLAITYLEDEQALYIEQRFVFTNRDDRAANGVIFYAAPNMFRRESALLYENDALEEVFPEGYAPGGLEMVEVLMDGESADWGWRGKNEMALRVGGRIDVGETHEFHFRYYVLLTRCAAFLGLLDTDVRLSAFALLPAYLYHGEFRVNDPLQHTWWPFTSLADYEVTLSLPDLYAAAGTGAMECLGTADRRTTWRFRADGVREIALSFGKRYREYTAQTEGGTHIRVLSNHRIQSGRVLECARETLETYEEWFGALPLGELDIVQTDYPLGAMSFPGIVWLPDALWALDGGSKQALRAALARQYFGCAAYPEPVADAWLSDVPCNYIALLATEELEGEDAFSRQLNDAVLDALNITIPGGMTVTTDAQLFTQQEYEIVVLGRGTVVMHELRLACGRDAFLSAFRRFYEMRAEKDVLGEYDLVAALDEATGGSWENFLTDWLFHVDDYVGHGLDSYE